MSVRTIWNWTHQDPRRRGRPPRDPAARLQARRRVSAEWHRQGRSAGWRPIAKALEGVVSVRMTQERLSEIKFVHRTHEAKRRRSRCRHVAMKMREALWSLDAAQTGRDRVEGTPIRSQVSRDVASQKLVVLDVSSSMTGVGTVQLLVKAKRLRGGLPLVLATDNGSENVNADVAALLENERVIHLKNLPRTPQHNAWAEHAIGELRAETDLHAKDVIDPSEARARLDGNRLRRCLGYRSAEAMDSELPVAYNRVSRESFYADARKRMENAVQEARSARERRLAEREAILCTMEEYGLLIRTRGDQ